MRTAILAICLFLLATAPACAGDPRPSLIQLPPGFSVELFARVPGARQMALGEKHLFVGTRDEGKVYALELSPDKTKAGRLHTLAQGLNQPNGVAFRNGDLYVAEISRLLRFPGVEKDLVNPSPPQTLPARFPGEEHHGWKYIAFGPDGLLYVPVGAPCNICRVKDPFATILRLHPDEAAWEVFARGIRNTVGFDWRPDSGELWFTDNGRDWMGDDQPPDELNRTNRQGLNFGYPFCHGRNIRDPEFGEGTDCAGFTPPVRELGPHVAALGMKFYRGTMFPVEYRGDILIAEHGSWNRTTPIGYRITRVSLDGPDAPTYQVFAEGWLRLGYSWGRPVDILELPDGSILVSDDSAGAIYRITYRGDAAGAVVVMGAEGL